MATQEREPKDIWKQMSYISPQGPCCFKSSLMTPACACLRFMVHPLKVATSFECDGCYHHASFHKMENKAEDEYIKRSKLAEAANVQNGVRPVREERRGEWARESRRLMNSTESSEMQEEVSVEEMIGAVAPASKRKRPAIANEAYLEAELLELEIIQKSLGVHGRKRREVKKLGTA